MVLSKAMDKENSPADFGFVQSQGKCWLFQVDVKRSRQGGGFGQGGFELCDGDTHRVLVTLLVLPTWRLVPNYLRQPHDDTAYMI